jgi:hypothetical protein
VHSDLARQFIVTYGFDRAGAVAYGYDRGMESIRRKPGGIVRTGHHQRNSGLSTILTVEFSAWATAASAPFGVYSTQMEVVPTGAARLECVVFDSATPGQRTLVQPLISQRQPEDAAVIEMSPAKRSLRDKSREEMSEFEREYPW